MSTKSSIYTDRFKIPHGSHGYGQTDNLKKGIGMDWIQGRIIRVQSFEFIWLILQMEMVQRVVCLIILSQNQQKSSETNHYSKRQESKQRKEEEQSRENFQNKTENRLNKKTWHSLLWVKAAAPSVPLIEVNCINLSFIIHTSICRTDFWHSSFHALLLCRCSCAASVPCCSENLNYKTCLIYFWKQLCFIFHVTQYYVILLQDLP